MNYDAIDNLSPIKRLGVSPARSENKVGVLVKVFCHPRHHQFYE